MTGPEEHKERPLVTFALFAYNQEKYIQEAIEGAFAQQYHPLEIVLSDDCSTDRTFEIIREMAASYQGPHSIKVRSSKENRGTLAHVLDVAEVSSGKYVIVAAGDDISKYWRTECSITRMEKNNLDVLSGGAEIFEKDFNNIVSRLGGTRYIKDSRVTGAPLLAQIHGATAAYKKSFLLGLPKPDKKILLEDYYFQLFAFWQEKRVESINNYLIFYRAHGLNIGPGKGKRGYAEAFSDERVMEKHYLRVLNLLTYVASNWDNFMHEQYVVCPKAPRIALHAIRYYTLKSKWRHLSLIEKIEFFIISRQFSNKRSDAARCLGPSIFMKLSKLKSGFTD